MSVTYLSRSHTFEFLDAEDYARYILQLLRETDKEYKAIEWVLNQQLEDGVRDTLLLAIADHTAKLYGFIK